VDASRFDELTRSLTAAGSRRRLLRGLAGVALGLAPGHLPVMAKSKGKKKSACLAVGKPCGGNNSKCCSGICKGKKPKKGKSDRSKCVAHNTGGCTPERSFCVVGESPSKCREDQPSACLATTGNAGFCAATQDFDPDTNCRVCAKDKDCEKRFGPGSACVIVNGGTFCKDQEHSCAGTNGSKGTACVAPAV
jgi:hypothetical protein